MKEEYISKQKQKKEMMYTESLTIEKRIELVKERINEKGGKSKRELDRLEFQLEDQKHGNKEKSKSTKKNK